MCPRTKAGAFGSPRGRRVRRFRGRDVADKGATTGTGDRTEPSLGDLRSTNGEHDPRRARTGTYAGDQHGEAPKRRRAGAVGAGAQDAGRVTLDADDGFRPRV